VNIRPSIWGIFPNLPPALGALIEASTARHATAAIKLRRNAENPVGQKFGFLTVTEKRRTQRGGGTVWACDCACGGTCETTTYNLTSGDKTFCSRTCPMRKTAFRAYARKEHAK
jgi:hypothetical protein